MNGASAQHGAATCSRFCTHRYVNEVRNPRLLGIEPVRELLLRSLSDETRNERRVSATWCSHMLTLLHSQVCQRGQEAQTARDGAVEFTAVQITEPKNRNEKRVSAHSAALQQNQVACERTHIATTAFVVVSQVISGMVQ